MKQAIPLAEYQRSRLSLQEVRQGCRAILTVLALSTHKVRQA